MGLKFTNVSSLRDVFTIRLEGYIGDCDDNWVQEEIIENTSENQEIIEKLLNLVEIGFAYDDEEINKEFNSLLKQLHKYLCIPKNEYNDDFETLDDMTITYYDKDGYNFNVELDK